MIEVLNGAANTPSSEAVLFPFDDVSIPFTAGLRLRLVHGKASPGPNHIVVSRGEPGEPDDSTVRYYGTVIQIGEELRMWYQARGSLDPPPTGGRGAATALLRGKQRRCQLGETCVGTRGV